MSGDRLSIRLLVDRPFAEVIAGGGYLYELMKRPDAGEALKTLTVRMESGNAGGQVEIESLQAFPMQSIWEK